ncbi:laminin subunit beta-4 [Chiloscyllium plagiosum]|uniref:laminin subunit beta-4 n=1 Tax=Chiloscyllium plagiosum TaxID=36176 RepID=UPI001CB7B837|nr:laminin subunit beta-4 [Chiloscyllium plagiosum]XP_043569549.1 laminin subunit beta-4 [Chiloscyllium plagiosum]
MIAQKRMMLQIFAILVLLKVVSGQGDCTAGSCYPPLGDLLVGRSSQLSASSTCGLNRPEKYCILSHLQDEQKCFTCDSRLPYNHISSTNSHRIENVITAFEPDRKRKWWQSKNGVHHVSIRLDLEILFQFSHLFLSFKTFRPAAMLVERSSDFGQTWRVLRYFAYDCASAFPNIPRGPGQRVDDVICDSKYSDLEPSTGGEVVLKALDPHFQINDPYSHEIRELITFTNLRINFTQLHTLGDTRLRRRQARANEKYYYALYEMVVRGSCFCYGHASQCIPLENIRGDVFDQQGMVHGRCICQHNTDGANCERCKDFYNDSPWQPAIGSERDECRRCNCNGHSEKCHFDMAVYLASGEVSGGICDECQHNTMGQNCNQCKPFFYQDPGRMISDPYACVACNCDPGGSLNNGMCESHTDPSLGTVAGRCICKRNVEGTRCDQCKPGYFGLSAVNPEGCEECRCDSRGSVSVHSVCDAISGECHCHRYVTGKNCEQCLPSYWGLGNINYGCSPCDCDIGGAYDNFCSLHDGQCRCLPNIIRRQCNEPAPGYFFAPLDYYLYEAELAKPIGNSGSLVGPTSLPPCDEYLRRQGYNFRVEHGTLILQRITKRHMQHQRKRQVMNPESQVQIVSREYVPGGPTTWTGLGFARVLRGTGLRFIVDNIPYPMDFTAAIRYESESAGDWMASIQVWPTNQPSNSQCRNNLPSREPNTVTLPATSRITFLHIPICLEPSVQYIVEIYFHSLPTPNNQFSDHILIDSLGLIPMINSLEDFNSKTDLDEYRRYRCVDAAYQVVPQTIPEVCERLIASMSARIHNGAIPCCCNPQGSISRICSKFGGQCQCKPGVIGRCCDSCAPGFYGFGANSCSPCYCNRQGAIDSICDQRTGQCRCHRNTVGHACDRCRPGYYGFPTCRPCQCNSHSESCNPQTGICVNCRAFATGNNCERCSEGYFGNPSLNEPCRPCQCPDIPNSGRYFAHSCYKDSRTQQLVCNCLEGHSGSRCERCSPGFYGTLIGIGDHCLPCSCNDNIDRRDPGACDPQTGKCLKCLHNTYGPNCQYCKPGYYGSALNKDCKQCTCNGIGLDRGRCVPNSLCMCDQATGQCPCLPNVVGNSCVKCAPGFWNLRSGRGCKPCYCDPQNSVSSQCDEVTGQCQCKAGYSGKTCSECQDNYYGNPRIQCISCNCSLEGTERPACDKTTGACKCREGVTGQHCNKCAWGYCKEFPKCTECHPCFKLIDEEICSIIRATESLINKTNFVPGQTPGPSYNERLKKLGKKFAAVANKLNDSVASPDAFEKTKDYFDKIREIKMQINTHLNISNNTEQHNRDIDDLNEEIDKLSQKVNRFGNDSRTIANASGNFEDINKYYQNSKTSQQKVNDSELVLNNSNMTREKAAALLNKTMLINRDEIHALNNKTKLLELSILKICGGQGNISCNESQCDEALCHDRFGNQRCNASNCTGILTLANSAYTRNNETINQMNDLLEKLQNAISTIDSLRNMTQETKDKANKLSDKVATSKDELEKEKQETKAIIDKVKEFLSADGVSPEDLEKIANHVLSIKLPISREELVNKSKQIQNIISEIKDLEKELERMNRWSEEAKTLLIRAMKTVKVTEEIPNPEELQEDLDKIKEAQKNVTDAIIGIRVNLNNSDTAISQIKKKTESIFETLMQLMNNVTKLQNEAEEVKNKTDNNKIMAQKAKEKANRAKAHAEEAEQEFQKMNETYVKLSNINIQKIPPDGKQKAEQLQQDAADLAKDLEEKLQRITALEKKLQDGYQKIKEKEDYLSDLEQNVTSIKAFIDSKVSHYVDCFP